MKRWTPTARRGGWALALSALAASGCSHAGVEHRSHAHEQTVRFAVPGEAADQLERTVAQPAEVALARVHAITHRRTTIRAGMVSIALELAEGADLLTARGEIMSQLTAGRATLPELAIPELEPPVGPAILRYTLRSPQISQTGLRELQDWTLRPRLLATAGLADITTCGGTIDEVHVDVDPRRLAASGVALASVAAAILAGSVDLPAGHIDAGATTIAVRSGQRRVASELVIAQHAGSPVRLGDVASIRDVAVPGDCRAADRRGDDVVTGTIYARDGQPPLDVRLAAEQAISKLRPELPAGVELVVLPRTRPISLDVEARATEVREALATLPDDVTFVVEHDGVSHVHLVGAAGDDQRALANRAVAALRGHGYAVDDRDELLVQVLGADLDRLAALVELERQALAARGIRVEGTRGVATDPEEQLELDRPMMARLGIEVDEVRETLSAASARGLDVGTLWSGSIQHDVVLHLPEDPDLGTLQLRAHDAGWIPLSTLVKRVRATVPREILRDDGERWAGLRVYGDPDVIRRAIGELPLPVGYRARLISNH
ncbi:MAG: efflux RND transporter permease subunit [Kofleriaceae bacterium]